MPGLPGAATHKGITLRHCFGQRYLDKISKAEAGKAKVE
jgi:hypothetical protein